VRVPCYGRKPIFSSKKREGDVNSEDDIAIIIRAKTLTYFRRIQG
jgi:hypothetical protein